MQRRTAAEWAALGVVCPRCRGALTDALHDAREFALRCASCDVEYPSVAGIPDLRLGEDPYLTRAEDREAARRLATRADSMSFAQLYASYYEGNDKVSAAQAAQFTRGVLAAGDRALASVEVWKSMDESSVRQHELPVIDLGCGTAPLGIALAKRGEHAIGVDVGVRWLVLARKRSAEQGIDLPVICANAEALPFRDGAVRRVVGESVLENLAGVSEALAECMRVTVSGGSIWLTTANRLSLAPDPHLGVMAGGWWSEAKLRAHAVKHGQVFPVRTLHDVSQLERALSRAGYRRVRVSLPRFAAAQVASLPLVGRAVVALYHAARRLPLARDVVLRVGPTLVCTATRP